MREIKFRAWDKQRKEYLSGGQILISVEPGKRPKISNMYLDILNDPNKYCDRFIIEQYTGLNDCKRTEKYPEGLPIYEGDILDGSYINPMNDEKVTQIYLVDFKNGNFYARLIGKSPYGDSFLYFKNQNCEVIGNRWEKPELLEGLKNENT